MPSRRSAWGPRLAWAAFILADFLWFAWDGLAARFAPDDMMNMAKYWEKGFRGLGAAQFDSTSYRPMGGLFYRPIFHFSGLDPFPYRLAILLILVANIYLVYRFASYLSGSGLVAALAALATSYHARLADIYYSTSVIYDILCFTFFFAAFDWYLRRRSAGLSLRLRDTFLILALYVCALNSKEMAVTLPVFLCLYECFYHPPGACRWAGIRDWVLVRAPVTLSASAITLLYIYAKTHGAVALAATNGYRPEFSPRRFMESSQLEVNSILYSWDFFAGWKLVLVWVVLLAVAGWKRDRLLGFSWTFILLSPLPIVFLERRVHCCLYIPLAGWALFASAVFVELAGRLARALSRWAHAPLVETVLISAGISLLGVTAAWHRQNIVPTLAASQETTWAVIRQLRNLDPKVAPESKVLFVDDPFKEWDMYFIAQLWFRDRTLEPRLQRKLSLPESEIAEMDYIFQFRGLTLAQVKPPN